MTLTQKTKAKKPRSKPHSLGGVSGQTGARPFSEHLSELRSRLLSSLGFLLVGSVVGYVIHDQILTILMKPLDQPIFYTSPAGGFDFVIKLSLFFGFMVSVPVFVYHLLRFIEPALPQRAPKRLSLALFTSCALLLIGVGFAYFVSLPAALYFLSSFSTDQIRSLITSNEYFTFVTRYLLGFGILFQLPLILWGINSISKVQTKSLMRCQKWVVLGSFVIAAFLTPTPDMFNQLLMAIPIILLYQVSIAFLWWINRKVPLSPIVDKRSDNSI